MVLALAGCGPGPEALGTVRGRVTFRGEPVARAVLIFSNPDKGVHIVAELRDDGTYEVEMARGHGLPLGTYQVSVSPPPPDLPPVGPAPPGPKARDYPNIPKRYRDPATSGLTLVVPEGGTVFDVHMEP